MEHANQEGAKLTMEQALSTLGDYGEPTQENVEAEQPEMEAETADDSETEQEAHTESDEYEEEAEDADEEDVEGEEWEEEAEDGEDEPVLHRVKVDGKWEEVTIDEALAGYSREKDYRKKTAELSDQRKEVETKEAAVSERLTTLDEHLSLLEQALSSPQIDDAQMERLAAEDPAEWAKMQQAKASNDRRLAAIKQQREAINQEKETKFNKAKEAYIADQTRLLHEKVPALANKEGQTRLANFLKETYGVGEAELNSILDHRFYMVAEEARLYRQGKSKTAEKVKAKPKMLKSQARKQAPSEGQKKYADLRAATKQGNTYAAHELLKMYEPK